MTPATSLQHRRKTNASPPATPPRNVETVTASNSANNSNNSATTAAAAAAATATIASPNRPRLHSRDPILPSSQKGTTNRLLPFELARSWHQHFDDPTTWLLLAVYVGAILLVEVLCLAILDTTTTVPLYWSWTMTHVVHLLLSITYLHWLKGSPCDVQGELAALTLWEQLLATTSTNNAKRRTLYIVPTVLCYASCHFANYQRTICVGNLILWSIHMVAKVPAMNGVRLFGINRTAGIDDEDTTTVSR